ncbi:unnamed protein product [Rhizoctonia solani]|uniref:Uncharacterized protein n=1 Tax=Rhizoctonia solani TaxID=456999 RepID=A0A8H2WW87_9AGAM|nr:unnamed protein product [Rhizoctonia solani]
MNDCIEVGNQRELNLGSNDDVSTYYIIPVYLSSPDWRASHVVVVNGSWKCFHTTASDLTDMPLTPGTYIIHDTDSDWVLAYYSSSKRIGTWSNSQADYEKASAHVWFITRLYSPLVKWYVRCYPGSSKYAIQDMGYKKYIAVAMDGDNPYGVEEEDASALELEHQFQDFYLIKLAGTKRYLEHPNIKLANNHTMTESHFKVVPGDLKGSGSGDTGSALRPKLKDSGLISSTRQSNTSSQVLGNLSADDVHFHTDILFNMPRAPFSQIQRIAALDWARKLGATNVPTIQSFDEYESRLEAALGRNNMG